MKQRSTLLISTLLIFILVATNSCKKIKDALNVDIALNSTQVRFTIPVITQTGAQSIADFNVRVDVDSLIKANNAQLAAKFIKSVYIQSCKLTMTDGNSSNNFSALESVLVMFKSNVNSTPQTLVTLTNNPNTESYVLDLPVNSTINLKDYFNATTFSYFITGSVRKTTSKVINCTADIKYTMNVGL